MHVVKLFLFIFRFFINLQEDGDHDCQNIALHINPRQCEDAVVRNSRVDGDWQEEERDIPYFPFNQGKTFQFKIEVTSDEFRIYVNGRHFCNFGHRVDLGRIHYLFLTEGAEFYDVTFQNKHVSSLFKVSKGAKIRNRYNQVPHLTQDTNGKVTNSQ